MSKENSKKETYLKCEACDFQKLKRFENNPVIRKLRDKIEQLNFRLTECKNENQMLKRNLQLAKKMVCQEVGGENTDFQALMKYGKDSGSKDRQENVLLLKTKVQELKDYLRELEGHPPTPKESPSEVFVKNQMPNDRKKLWRMELERRLARENAEKDINPLIQECFELRKSLETERSRFQELNEEVKLLKTELRSQVEKNEEDFGIVESFKTLEKQLEETSAERSQIRQDLEGSRTRNKRLSDEISSMKEELQILQKKTNDNNALIDTLTASHKSIQEAIDFEKAIVEQNVERYEKELKVFQENQTIDFEILDHLQCIICDRNTLIDELGYDLESKDKDENQKKENSRNKVRKAPRMSNTPGLKNSKDKTPKKDVIPDTKEQEADNKPSDSELKVRKLKLECAKYKALCEAAKMEGDHLSILIENQDKKMNEIAVQVVETGRLNMQKNVEKKETLEKVNKLQKSLSAKRRRGKFYTQSKSRLDELRIKNDAQKEENDFLRNFLRSAVCSKAKELQQFKGLITDNKHFFDACLREIKELMDSEAATEQSDRPMTDSADEFNN